MSQVQQFCERINDTFVVKCVEKIQPETYLGLEISDLISVIIAFFSVLAASFAGYAAWKANKLSESEAKANREHNILSIRPALQFETFLSSSEFKLKLRMSNNGLGPAFIKSYKLNIGDIRVDSLDDYIKVLNKMLNGYNISENIQIERDLMTSEDYSAKIPYVWASGKSENVFFLQVFKLKKDSSNSSENREKIDAIGDSHLAKQVSDFIGCVNGALKIEVIYEDGYGNEMERINL